MQLEHHTELLQAIEVHGHRNLTSAADIGGTLSGEQLDRTVGADLADVLAQLPGVRTVATGANVGRPIVDGLSGARLQIIQGGSALASQDWGDDHAPEVDPFAAANIQLARGGATVGYGASTTGATLIVEEPGMPTHEGVHGQVLGIAAYNASQLGGGVAVGQRLSTKWGYRAQGFHSTSADARAPDYVLSNTAARRTSGQGRVFYADSAFNLDLGYRLYQQESGILRAAHIGSTSDFERALESGEPTIIRNRTRDIDAPRQASTHHWVSARGDYRLRSRDKVEFNYGTQVNLRQEFDLRRGGRSAKPSLDMRLTTNNLRLAWVPEQQPGYRGKLGAEVTNGSNRNVPGTGVRPFVPYYNINTYGAFAEQTSVTDKVSWSLGARVDYRQTDAIYFDSGDDGGARNERVDLGRREWVGAASAGVVRYFDRGASLRGRLAYASRTPNPAERFADGVHHALAVIERGDTSMQVEHGLKASLGVSFEPREKVAIHLTGFAQAFSNFIYAQQAAAPELTIRGTFPVFEYRQADALLVGVDFDVHAPLGPLQVNTQVSYLYGERRGGQALPDISPFRIGSGLSYSRSFNRRLKDWRAGINGAYTARASYTPDNLLAPAPDAYFLLSAELSGHVLFGEQTLGVHLTANNLLDARYRDYLDRLRFYADRPGRDVQVRLSYDF